MPNSTVYNTGAYDSQRGAGCHSDQLVLYSILPILLCLVPIQHHWTSVGAQWPTVVALGHWVPTGVQHAVWLSAEVLDRSSGLGLFFPIQEWCATSRNRRASYSPPSHFSAVAPLGLRLEQEAPEEKKKKRVERIHSCTKVLNVH